MGLSFPLIILIVHYLVSLMMFNLILFASSSGVQPLWHDDERFALLQFKESFTISQSASTNPSAYPKVSSWKPDQISDCCKWDGVECNKDTGHVIGLDLNSSCLKASVVSGQIPSEILELSKLVSLDLSYNHQLKLQKSGLTVIAQNFTNLEVLNLAHVVISSNVPNILANLTSLTSLTLNKSDLHGEFPVGIFHLPNLQLLHIEFNEYLTGYVPELNITSPLVSLRLAFTNFYGEIPDSIGHLKSLVEFNACICNFLGEIPSSLGNLTNLIVLNLQSNRLHGSIPQSISRLVNLEALCLNNNYFSGRVEFELFLRLGNLDVLQFSGNNISFLTNTNSTFPKFSSLVLNDCDLREFPEFLRDQDQLEYLELGGNKIHGQVPKWMGNVSIETLMGVGLDHNFLTGFDQFPVVLPYVNLKHMWLDFNMLQGSVPIPPPSIDFYTVSNNRLTGEIPYLICNLSSVTELDLSSNNLSGNLPQCLGNLSASLKKLDLHSNNFHGTIPRICGEANELMMIDFSTNHLQGRVPRSLADCTKLEAVNLGNNQIHDIFPSWLGILPELRILILRSNELYGTIGSSDNNFDFPKLHIIDLSNNDLTGKLPSEHFQNWKAMQIVDDEQLKYMEEQKWLQFSRGAGRVMYSFSMTMMNKGTEMVYQKVSNLIIVIDLSRNRFEGEIPEVVGHLKGLNLLNLSQNFLTGPMPHGKQFDIFNNNSFSENLELCGSPLSKKCGNLEDSLPPSSSQNSTNHNSEFLFEFGWKVVAMGYGCGFVFGVVFGQIVITKKYGWFMKTFAIGQPNRRRVNWKGRRN
ncbi:receptor-like protein 7 [Juglans regia]|uniref:Receptor-like protein 7 n=1 Tax=Juglans regia TaxID=51240 RepID=A0A6P9EGT5_JUGRE|nr:receptor-like protein 7 [Juglans regia]